MSGDGTTFDEVEAEAADWLGRIARIHRHQKDGVRSVHKPVLILYALAHLQREGSSELRFTEAEQNLGELIVEFGPPSARPTPNYPFRRLANDEGLWQVRVADGSVPGENIGDLRKGEAVGSFTPEFEAALRADPGLAALVAYSVLDSEWEESLHEDICRRVGLDPAAFETTAIHARARELVARRRRDPAFRQNVLEAYEYRCAMCGYDGRIGAQAVGLEAAHVRWWTYDGPDEVGNGLCLCSLHHKLLDRGVLGLTEEHTVAVSRQFVGHSPVARDAVVGLAGRPVLEPQAGLPVPEAAHVRWHAEEVFRGPSRPAA